MNQRRYDSNYNQPNQLQNANPRSNQSSNQNKNPQNSQNRPNSQNSQSNIYRNLEPYRRVPQVTAPIINNPENMQPLDNNTNSIAETENTQDGGVAQNMLIDQNLSVFNLQTIHGQASGESGNERVRQP